MKQTSKTIKILLTICCLSLLLVFVLTACQRCEHQYDNACDESCNLCEKTRTIAGHDFAPATCTTPKTCIYCDATEGSPVNHDYSDATCLAPKTCPDCGATEGSPLEHNDTNGDYICDNGCNQPTITKQDLQTIVDNTLALSNVFVHQQTHGALDDYYYITNNFVYQHLDGDSPRYFYNEQDVTYSVIITGEGCVKEQIQETVLFQLSYLFEGEVETEIISNLEVKNPTYGILAGKNVLAFVNSSNTYTGFVLNESGTLLDGIVLYDEGGNFVVEYAFTIVEEGSEPNEQIAQIEQSFEHALDCAVDFHELDKYTYSINSIFTTAYKVATCKHCGKNYNTEEVNTTYQNGKAVATFEGDDNQSWSLTDGTQLSATQLQEAIIYMLNNGETNIDLTLPAEADIDKLVAVRNALLYVSEGGVIDLTLRGITEIPFYSDGSDEGIFGTWYVGEMPVMVDALKSVTLTDATLIEYRSFNGAFNLTTVSAPLVTEIWDGAFADTGLTQVHLPLAKIIGAYAFDHCQLAEISLPSAEEIRYGAFNHCTMLSKAYLPNVTTIGYNAFYRCDVLEEITFGNLQFVDHSTYGIFHELDMVLENLNVTIPCNQSALTLGEDNCWRATDGLYRDTTDYQNNLFMGYTFKSVNFSHQAEYTINNDGTHTANCTSCDHTQTIQHTFDENGGCVCGEKVKFVSNYDELATALVNGGKIALLVDISADTSSKIEIAKDVQLYLNGKTLTNIRELHVVDGASFSVLSQGELDFFDLNIDGGVVNVVGVQLDGAIQSTNKTSVLNVSGGYIQSIENYYGTINIAQTTVDYVKIAIGTVTIDDCTLRTAQIENSTCTITDGNISETLTLVATNSTITNTTFGTITITDNAVTNLTDVQTNSLIVTNTGDGLCTVDGDKTLVTKVELLSSGNCTVKGGKVETVYLYSGTFTLDGGWVNCIEVFEDAPTCNIYDGHLASVSLVEQIDCITGGTFGFDPSKKVDTQLYTVTNNSDGTWTVSKK